MTETVKGLRASIYTNPHYAKCSNGGISERVSDVTIVGIRDTSSVDRPLPRDSQVFPPSEDAPAVRIVYRSMGSERLVHIEPIEPVDSKTRVGYMAGGAFVESSDSRFRALTGFYGAVSLHDRTETWEHYNSMD